MIRSVGGSVFSYNGSSTQFSNNGYGNVPGYAYGKQIGYYDLAWASRAVVVVGAGV